MRDPYPGPGAGMSYRGQPIPSSRTPRGSYPGGAPPRGDAGEEDGLPEADSRSRQLNTQPQSITNEGAKHMPSRSRHSRWPYVRRLAWERDLKAQAPCHICGQPINYLLEPSSAPDAWEPDHLIPVAQRPDLELDLLNIAPSHTRCNRSRGDGTNGENVLGQQSRIW